jgi:cytidylate kinase
MHFITFSRRYGTGGSEIARKVAEKLGYKLYDTDALEHKAGELGFKAEILEVGERPPSFFQRIFSSKPTISLERLHSIVYELAKQGDAVFLGWGSHMLLKSFDCALHVRIIASKEKRIENLVKRGLSPDDARRIIEKADHDREAFLKFAFGIDWDDPDLYDIVLNMDKLSADTAVDIVVKMAQSAEIKACSVDAMRRIEALALQSRAEAALMEAGLAHGHTLSVSVNIPDPGVVEVTGFVEDQKAIEEVEQALKAVPGVNRVLNRLRIMPTTRYA